MEAYKHSSDYSSPPLEILRDGIKHIPEWHLDQLCKYLKNYNLDVAFLTDDLRREGGVDLGGVKRDYIATLAASLQELNTLFTPVEGSLKLPRILRGEEVKDPIISCNEEESTTYKNLGRLFYKCYNSSTVDDSRVYQREIVTTGCFFSEALFKSALSLKKADFNNKPDAYIKIAKALLNHMDTEGTPYIKNYIEYLDLTADTLDDFLNSDNPALYGAVMLADEDYYTNEDGDPDIEKIKSDPQKFIDDLQAGIFRDTDLVKNFQGVPLGAMLDPVYQVSFGFVQSVPSWSTFRANNPVEVSNQIQGSLDREKIAGTIQCNSFNPTVKSKARWLKQWIENEATDEELKTFLRFVTGSASLPEGKKIKIEQQAMSQPFPTVCTCGLGISVSNRTSYSAWKKDKWDDSYDHFIRNLKQAMVIEGFQVS